MAASALLLASCGGAQPASPSAPSPLPTQEAADEGPWVLGATAEDEPFRYQIPDPVAPPPFTPPEVLRATTEAGTTLLVVEDHTLPLVAIALHATFRREPLVSGARAGWMLALLDRSLRGSTSPVSDVAEGLEVGAAVDLDALSLVISAPARRAPEVIQKLVAAARRGALELGSAKKLRERRRVVGRETSRSWVWAMVDEVLFPPGHPLRGAWWGTSESFEKMTLADLERARDADLAPDAVTIVAVGDIRLHDVREAVQRDEALFPPPKGRADLPKRATPFGSGAVIVEDRGVSGAEIHIAFPRQATDQEPRAAAVTSALRSAFREPEGAPPSWALAEVEDRSLGDTSTLRLSVHVAPNELEAALETAKQRLAQVRERGASIDDMWPFAWQEWLISNYDGVQKSRDRIVTLLDRGLGPEADGAIYESFGSYKVASTIQFAAENLDPKRGVLVVVSREPVDEEAIRSLGFGPITRKKAPFGDGGAP